jgi:hypothetical protein
MDSKPIIISLVISIIILLFALWFFGFSLPFIPHHYDLTCRDNVGDSIRMEDSCQSVTDCQEWKSTNCGPENSCNNRKIDCRDNRCITTVYFRLNKQCV